jgi:hypothetical protein
MALRRDATRLGKGWMGPTGTGIRGAPRPTSWIPSFGLHPGYSLLAAVTSLSQEDPDVDPYRDGAGMPPQGAHHPISAPRAC